MQNLKPYFSENSAAVVFCVDENYAKYLSISLISLISNSNNNTNYEIYILTEKLSAKNNLYLNSLAKSKPNIHIKIIDIQGIVKKLGRDIFFESRHIKVSAYYRLFIPEIFHNFEKIVYLDVDTIIESDIAEFFNQDIKAYPMGVIEDFHVQVVKEISKDWYVKRHQYNTKVLGMHENSKYFNSGVILFNIEMIKENFIFKIKEKLLAIKNPKHHDQDILNSLYAHEAKYLDLHWNIQIVANKFIKEGTSLYNIYHKALNKPKIIHFIYPFKPWRTIFFDQAHYFWKYAKLTPHYEPMIVKMNIEFNNFNLLITKLKYNFYKILLLITLGNSRIKLKKMLFRSMVAEIRNFLKSAKDY